MKRSMIRPGMFLVAIIVAFMVAAPPAGAYEFTRSLREGDSGRDVKRLQVRVAGWYPYHDQSYFALDGDFGPATEEALEAFEEHYALVVDGIAEDDDYDVIYSLEDDDRSTAHFEYGEFKQNYNSACSAKANAYADTFSGGMVSKKTTRRNVRRLMWRLEAVRAKAEDGSIGINSGFRSVPYNDCIGGAGASQHMYGTAADNRVSGITNRRARKLAKRSDLHGIGCYSDQTHNHFDTRMDNNDLESSQFWWWPERDDQGRDLDDSGRPCWGEDGRGPTTAHGYVLAAILDGIPGVGSSRPSGPEIAAFERSGERVFTHGAD